MSEPFRYSLLDLPRVFWRMASFCDIRTICNLMQLNSKANTLATHDNVWKDVLGRANLDTTLMQYCNTPGNGTMVTAPSGSTSPQAGAATTSAPVSPLSSSLMGGQQPMSVYQFFMDWFVSPRILNGTFSFLAQSAGDNEDYDDGAYTIYEAIAVISLAKLGCPSPRHCARAQLILHYKSGQSEVLEGIIRYSAQRQAFMLSTVQNGCTTRGPTFIVLLTRGTRRWANQAMRQFQNHQGGIRLVMTPLVAPDTVANRLQKGSQMTISDIIAVSKGPPSAASPSASPAASPSKKQQQVADEL